MTNHPPVLFALWSPGPPTPQQRGFSELTVAPGKAKNRLGDKVGDGIGGDEDGGEELRGRLSQFQPWETAGLPLTSWLVEVSPLTTAIRSKSLAWNMTKSMGFGQEGGLQPQPN
ncbi:protein CBFA2T3-like protein [Lates japonicus]|uniref:Protein CBFA2T3-like protein n=1 Tax=Lates japonicus TaxID=270547 RepID=A0AAD3RN62_LATJO|nr:protein CBFA2T3-like protein [Lates japonicus]